VYENRELEITSQINIDVDAQLDIVNGELESRGTQRKHA
jgi:hypothetical protein